MSVNPVAVITEALNGTVQGEPITDVYLPEGLAIIVLNALNAAGLLRSPDPVRPPEPVIVERVAEYINGYMSSDELTAGPAYSFNSLSEILSLREQVAQLRQWQAETLQVLDGWDRVWTTASRRSRSGESKSDVVLREITRLQAEVGKEDDDGRSDRAGLERRGPQPGVSPGDEGEAGRGVAGAVPGAGSEVRPLAEGLAPGALPDIQSPPDAVAVVASHALDIVNALDQAGFLKPSAAGGET